MKRVATEKRKRIAKRYHARDTVEKIAEDESVSTSTVRQCATEFPPKPRDGGTSDGIECHACDKRFDAVMDQGRTTYSTSKIESKEPK